MTGEKELAELEAHANAAGPQRWFYQEEDGPAGYRIVDEDGLIVMGYHGPDDQIAPFCAAMNPAQALALVDEVRRLRALARDAYLEGAKDGTGEPCDDWWPSSAAFKALEATDGR